MNEQRSLVNGVADSVILSYKLWFERSVKQTFGHVLLREQKIVCRDWGREIFSADFLPRNCHTQLHSMIKRVVLVSFGRFSIKRHHEYLKLLNCKFSLTYVTDRVFGFSRELSESYNTDNFYKIFHVSNMWLYSYMMR